MEHTEKRRNITIITAYFVPKVSSDLDPKTGPVMMKMKTQSVKNGWIGGTFFVDGEPATQVVSKARISGVIKEREPLDVRINRAWDVLTSKVIDGLIEVGKIFDDIITEDHENYKELQKKFGFSIATILMFIKVGRGEILPKLAVETCPAANVLIGRPVKEQLEFTENKIPVLVRDASGFSIENKWYTEMSTQEVARVFSPKGLRNAEEQKTFFLERVEKKKEIPELRFEYLDLPKEGQIVRFYAVCDFNREQLSKVLADFPNPDPAKLQAAIQSNQIK